MAESLLVEVGGMSLVLLTMNLNDRGRVKCWLRVRS